MDEFISDLFGKDSWLTYGIILLGCILVGLVVRWLLLFAFRSYHKKKPSALKEQLLQRLKTPTKFLLPLVFIYGSFSVLKINSFWQFFTEALIIISIAWVLVAFLWAGEAVIKEKLKLDGDYKAKERRALTQLRFIKSMATIVIITLAVASILWNIPAARQLGETILASAGIVGIIVGIAAQKSIANFITGFQVAFTQPIKIDDIVVVEGEFGTVEDVTLTYVVIKTWDWRRLVLPLSYFNEKPFVNWSFNSQDVVNSVFFYVDYNFPVAELREKFMALLEESNLWDKRVADLLVTGTGEHSMVLRATFSTKNASAGWNLRCGIREELIKYIQENYPGALPKLRNILYSEELKVGSL
jgi:small-conductance mechanosensitive channel